MSLEYEQQPGESSRAFHSFTIYRDLGPTRSLSQAYQKYRGETPKGLAPGQWNLWSTKYRWVDRAAAYDAHCDAERRKLRESLDLQLEVRRWQYERDNQDRLERRVARMEAVLDKADSTPVTDVIQVKEEEDIGLAKRTKTRTTVKALKMSGYARLVEATNETAKQAIVGVRPEKKEKKAESGPAEVTGLILKPPSDDVQE